ncbi:MAG TPA: hypothetical protein VFZ84_02435 [Burkholderiales bacterium]
MAEERDPLVSRRYRELGAEEPPPALDEAILAASRQAAAPRRRWYVPLAAAAVAVLGIGVALHVQREQPEPEAVTAPSEAKEAPRALKRESVPAAPPAQPQAERQESRMQERAADAVHDSPERVLERIAALRKQGRHEEADKALAEFRRRYPDYRIPEEMREKIEKKQIGL